MTVSVRGRFQQLPSGEVFAVLEQSIGIDVTANGVEFTGLSSLRSCRIADLVAEEREHALPFLRREFEGEPAQAAVAKVDAKSAVYEGGKLEIRSALDE